MPINELTPLSMGYALEEAVANFKEILAREDFNLNSKDNLEAILAREDFNVNTKYNNELIDLLLANSQNALEIVTELTSLNLASSQNALETVKELLKKEGININAQDNNELTALYLASLYEDQL